MTCYPKLTQTISRLGQIETVNARLYKRNIQGIPLYRYDLYETLESYLNSKFLPGNSYVSLELVKIRKTLQQVLSGNTNDNDAYRKLLTRCLKDSKLFRQVFVHLFATKADFNIFRDMLVPMNKYINLRSTELLNKIKATLVMQDCGYLYVINPLEEGDVSYVIIR